MRGSIFSSLFLGFLVFAAAGPAAAQPRHGRGPEMRGGVQPLDRLLPGIRRGHPGDFYDAEGPTYGPQGDPHYHLKWMTPDGRVIWYDADARSGRVLRSSPGRDSFDGPARAPYTAPYPPYTGGSYDRGYGREDFNRGGGYARPYGGWRGGWRRGR
jgi:hypothetical protein